MSVLKHIARVGHVYAIPRSLGALVKSGGSLRPELVGVNKASTFTGFCSHHDSTLFAPIETGSLRACEEHAFLLAFRAVCYELFAKEAGVLSDKHRRELDRGKPLPMQKMFQDMCSDLSTGCATALRDLQEDKAELDAMFRQCAFSQMEYCVFWLLQPPDFMCCGCDTPLFDYSGKALQDLGDLGARMQTITFSLMGSGDRGCAFFSWPLSSSIVARAFIRSLLVTERSAIPQAFVRYVSSNFENVYLRPEWWEGLDASRRDYWIDRLKAAADLFTPFDPDVLIDDGLRLVEWEVIGMDSNVAELASAWRAEKADGRRL